MNSAIIHPYLNKHKIRTKNVLKYNLFETHHAEITLQWLIHQESNISTWNLQLTISQTQIFINPKENKDIEKIRNKQQQKIQNMQMIQQTTSSKNSENT